MISGRKPDFMSSRKPDIKENGRLSGPPIANMYSFQYGHKSSYCEPHLVQKDPLSGATQKTVMVRLRSTAEKPILLGGWPWHVKPNLYQSYFHCT